MDLGVHLPLIEFGDEGQSPERLQAVAETARDCGFAAISANDHFLFQAPWIDGLTALASVIRSAGDLTPATTISLAVMRGPVALAKALAALDILSEGRLIAGVGPGSSRRDYEAVGIPFEERWPRFEEAVRVLRALLEGRPWPEGCRFYPAVEVRLEPRPRRSGGIPLWIGSWGSDAGLRRVARLADGWLASAYNTTPEGFRAASEKLRDELEASGRAAAAFPNALATMWTWVTDDVAEAEAVVSGTLAPLLRRDPGELRERLCIGPPGDCAEILSAYEEAGCDRVYMWPVGDERRQIELIATEVLPRLEA
jgi:alkanesulfonate monooxygenase SsuD/methylene tetrahydromethanopterin reductase-like flavin-dependent oxidoreductase (luciferase family)